MRYFLIALCIPLFSCDNSTVTQSNKIDTSALAQQCREEAKSVYMAASKLISDVQTEIQLGNSKGAVLLCNTTQGSEMGRLDNVEAIKKKLDSSGHQYVLYKWYRAAADIARQKAAESGFETDKLISQK
jgi:hypothetical protein